MGFKPRFQSWYSNTPHDTGWCQYARGEHLTPHLPHLPYMRSNLLVSPALPCLRVTFPLALSISCGPILFGGTNQVFKSWSDGTYDTLQLSSPSKESCHCDVYVCVCMLVGVFSAQLQVIFPTRRLLTVNAWLPPSLVLF